MKKSFDCVEFKREAQARLYEATRDMSAEERREYMQRVIENGPLAEFWARVKREARTAPKAGRV
jgi:hypothetical protein